jgi:cyclohexa-1,5-dienecarbonyl-CoA hydratase
MSDILVHVGREGGVGRILLDRPPLNVLDLTMMAQLSAGVRRLGADPKVRVVAIAGEGKTFCAGVDVADHSADRVGLMLERFHGAIRDLIALEQPVVALVHGAALGGGCELALACDMVLARDDATLGQPEIRLGVFPPVAAALLPRLVGRQRAMELVLSGRTLGAEAARAMGLISEVFPSDRWQAETHHRLERMAALSGSALRLAKRAVTGGLDLPFSAALSHAEDLYLHELMVTADAQEGIAAFLQKRKPVWQEA